MDQLVELEDRLACAVVLRQGAKFPDEGTLGHFLEAERGDDLIDMAFFPDNQLAVDLADWLDQAMLVLRGSLPQYQCFNWACKLVKRGFDRLAQPGDV